MKKRWKIVLVLMAGIGVTLLGWYAISHRAARKESPDEYYLKVFARQGQGVGGPADMHFRLAGSNAVPFLIRQLECGETIEQKYYRAWRAISVSVRAHLPNPSTPVDRPLVALRLLDLIGARAVAAVPAIVALANREADRLRPISPVESESIIITLTNRSAMVLAESLDVLETIGGTHPQIVPTLFRASRYAGIRNRLVMVRETNLFAAYANAFPLLKEKLNSPDRNERELAAAMLGGLASQHKEAVPLLVAAVLHDRDPIVREKCILGLFGAKSLHWHVVPVLENLTRDPDEYIADVAGTALEYIRIDLELARKQDEMW